MCRFYSLTPCQVEKLPVTTANQMWLAITPIEARELLNQIVVTSYPNLDKNKRRDLVGKLEKQATVKEKSKSAEIKNEDLDKWLRGVLGG